MRAFRVRVGSVTEEWATALLWEAGTCGIEVRPAGDSTLELLAYFADTIDAQALQTALPSAEIEPAEIPQVDWVARFREGFRAFRAGRFHVVPVWELPAHDRRCSCGSSAFPADPEPSAPAPDSARQPPADSADVLVVDPGRAFGTGTHETTRLCLTALEGLAARRPLGRTLDLGAGTGILAVAAARLGGSPVVASDIDPDATASSRVHAGLNGTRLPIVRADGGRGFRSGSFDLVLANLMALLLVDRSPEIRSLLAPGGSLVLSGLLVADVELVHEAFAACGTPLQLRDGEWAALVYEGRR
jgi:ribosomal protein L11 methylase PrmA